MIKVFLMSSLIFIMGCCNRPSPAIILPDPYSQANLQKAEFLRRIEKQKLDYLHKFERRIKILEEQVANKDCGGHND